MNTGTQGGPKTKLLGNRIGAAPRTRCAPQSSLDRSISTQTIANGNLTRGRLRRHHPSALDAGEDGLQLWLWMLSALRAPQAHSTCRFECPHSGSTHLHVVVEPHAPHSHDHMIVCMYHAGSAFLLLHLPTPKESSVASHKCHFRVRHFGRVFSLPYKTA